MSIYELFLTQVTVYVIVSCQASLINYLHNNLVRLLSCFHSSKPGILKEITVFTLTAARPSRTLSKCLKYFVKRALVKSSEKGIMGDSYKWIYCIQEKST
jgi:hypothetical protein